MKRTRNLNFLMVLLALLMVTCLWPAMALSAAPGTVTVRIIGEDSIILNTQVNVDQVNDYTTDINDSNGNINALDAVIYATLQNSSANDSYNISYNSTYGSYFLGKLAGISPAGSDYWGTLAINSSGDYDGNTLNTHALVAGDTYIVYYDMYTGADTNYGYQSYACFKEDTVSGTTYGITTVEPITTGYDAGNIVPTALPGITIYATGPNLVTATPIAVTNSNGKAYITFPDVGQYILTLSSDYIYTRCDITITGSSITLNDVSINVTDGTNNLPNALLTLTDSPGNSPHSPYEVTGGAYKYRLTDGTYKYSASLSGYEPVTGTLTVSGATSQNVVLTARAGYEVTITPADSTNETVIVKNGSGIVQPISVASGVYTYDLADGNYNYSINRSGYHSSFGSFTVNGAGQAITTSALTRIGTNSAEWSAFRDFSDNMATVTFPAAQGSWQAREKWATSLGAPGSWGTLSTSNIVLYDGYLYVATEHGLSKIDKSDGTLLTTTALSTGTSYASQIAYGNGKIFVTTASGIDAFDALTMERLWSAPISPYGNYMAATPILFSDATKTIYVGDYGDSNYTLGTCGGYSCLDANNGTSKWIMYGGATDARYWAGAVLVGDYVVFGSDSGTLTSVKIDASENAVATGTLPVTGKINSSIAYDGAYLYFTTKSGYIYKASIDNTGQLVNVTSRQFATDSSSTPVVHNGRIYVGASDGIYVLKAEDLTQISYYKTSAAVQSSALLTTAYGSVVYAYFTVNSPQGEIIVLSDDSTNLSFDTLFIPTHYQYSLTSLIADSQGTIYSTNDSGYLYAIENNNASKTDKVKLTISVSPASVFDSTTWTTTYPTIIVKDSNGMTVSTAVSGTYYLETGRYSYTVSLSGYTTATGSFVVTGDDITNGSRTVPITLTTPSTGGVTITVTVTVIGDTKHGNSVHTAYQTWVNSKSVTISSGAAWDAIKSVLDSSGLNYVATDTSLGKYISSVNGLAEMDNGPNSGWMYSVNGTNPTVEISSYILKDGDNITLYYTDDYKSQTSPGSGSDPSSTLPTVSPSTPAGTVLTGTLDKTTGIASATLSGSALSGFNKAIAAAGNGKGSDVTVTVSTPVGATALNLAIPQAPLTALGQKSNISLSIKTNLCNLTFDPKAIAAISSSLGSEEVILSIAQLNASALSNDAKEIIGDRPVYDFSLKAGETNIANFGGGSAAISIPYTLAASEDANAIVVYCIDASGSPQMTQGAYSPETKTVDFKATHFSRYAVGYNKIVFADVADNSWYKDAVTFCAARGITVGIGNVMFGPEDTLTRGQFIVMLMRAYGIELEKNPAENFADAGETYYTNYLAAAKRLGISKGIGDNKFSPNSKISRQDMFTLLYRALDVLGALPTTKTNNTLSSYSDTSEISGYAMTALKLLVESGIVSCSDGKINPGGNSTRAQMVQILYNILSQHV